MDACMHMWNKIQRKYITNALFYHPILINPAPPPLLSILPIINLIIILTFYM